MKQQQLQGFDLSEEDMYKIAVMEPLQRKIDSAIALLRMYEPTALRSSENGYYLAYSGGKDSGVILKLAELAGVKFEAYYNVTTIDPPELVRFIRRVHPEVNFNRPEKHLLNYMVERCKGLPVRMARWCCLIYKEQGGNGRAKIIGVRAEESKKRKGLWKPVTSHRKNEQQRMFCPIVYWTDDDVWEFHRMYNLPYCQLYDEGFKRLGCIGCPMGGQKQIEMEFARWPGYERLFKRKVKEFFEKWRHIPTRAGKPRFFAHHKNWESYWDWWISGVKHQEESEVCQGMFLGMFDDENEEE